MGEIYLMEKNGFEKFVGCTVKYIEELLPSINFVSVNRNPARQDYKLRKKDKAIIAVEKPQIKKVLIEK